MKKIYRYLIIAFSSAALFSSCTKYLDLQPEDKLLENQVFSSAKNVNAYLNGLYVKLGGSTLYGENLTLTIPDVLAQRYNIGASHIMFGYSQQRYTDGGVAAKMAEIWGNAYSLIFNINGFLANLDKAPGVLDSKTDSTSRGEALAMRASMHFDLLRLFGPMYSTADSTLQSIPYNTQSAVTILPFLPANEVMNRIMADLSKAESLLSSDKTMNASKKYRFTFYSVKAMQARVNLYRGNKAEALAAAMVLIQNSAKFPWVTLANMNDRANCDRIFSSEMILGAYNADLYTTTGTQAKYFSSSLADNSILAPLDARLIAMFPETTDFRYGFDQLWGKPATKNYKTFLKYADIEDKSKAYRNTIPMLKLSEMYYIAAECEPDPTTAIGYLNTVRYNRNLGTPVNAAQLTTEITKEYQKEFFGEGQLFFYYKRNKFTTIPAGNSATANYTMGTEATMRVKYVVPIPTSETDPRK
ncbi:RagB/SusD family nutrient uptake outer membrane protein [Pedobacter nutrimenti]|uniref:RagB/SusD family nutrient uptake outer membrane protein n=1 Tax=Pedobacter nutrimenti TaxID=1241337 RepID=UPI002930F0E0|nr:RagB/SusD family nutrient uptake outer membrane protein [Pedobacter nutrimenti]